MDKYFLKDAKWICAECQREFNSRQATTSHIHRAHTNPGISYGGHQVGKPTWNKGLNKETDARVANNAASVSIATKGKVGHKHSDATKKILSQKASINNKGGRAKWYEVAGQKVQGTWERNVALKLEELGIEWKKLKTHRDILEYSMDGKVRSYTPDFYLPYYDLFLEVKGYWWGKDKEKMDIVAKTYPNKKIVVLEKEQYEKFLGGELVW
jgi:hypothetical protein